MGWGIGIGIGWANRQSSDGNAPVNVTAPVVSGNPVVGNILVGTNGTWTSDTGITGYLYQWRRNGTPITGATNSTYTTVLEDVAKDIVLTVRAIDSDGISALAQSNTIRVKDGQPPYPISPPVISGTAAIGQTLTTTVGSWGSDTTITSYTYRWYRDNVLISGANSNTYVLTSDDVSKVIQSAVAATDIDGTSGFQFSNEIFLFDVDYSAILTRATSLGYTLPIGFYQRKQSVLLTTMKSIGVWNKLDIFYNFASYGSQEFATLNWKAPTSNQVTLFNSPFWNPASGFLGNSTNMYLDTNFQLSSGVNYTQNNASRYVYINSASGSVYDGSETLAVNTFRSGTSIAQRINQGVVGISAFVYNTNPSMKSIHRTSTTNVTLFNGTVSENRTVSSAVTAAANQFILRSVSTYGGHLVSMYAVGSSLVSENTDFVNAYNTYINSI